MKTIVVIEDEEKQREGICDTLRQYGFRVLAGETMAQCLELLDQHKNDVAVIVIDMVLTEFSDYKSQSKTTGIGLTRKLLNESTIQRPEVIILTVIGDNADYYKQAIKVGASEYLSQLTKKDTSQFVAVVQALALKHSFQPNLFNDAEIMRLSEGHANSFELLDYFCRNKLVPELDTCLSKGSYVLLLRDKSGGESFSAYSDIDGISVTEFPQIFAQPSRDNIFATKGNQDGFTFIPLVNILEVEIALGILTPFPIVDELGYFPFSEQSLAESLTEHASPVIETFVEKTLLRWNEKQSIKLERVKTLVDLSGVVQRQISNLLVARKPNVKSFLQKLTDYNRTLSTLLESKESAAARSETTRISEVVQEIKAEYDRSGHFDDLSINVEADCLVRAERHYLSLALRELIRWAIERRPEVPGGKKQLVQIRCAVQGNWMEIYFTENSKRLPKSIRENYLFEPMSPLQLAQMIIEITCHGKLVDATDELEPLAAGHLFKIRLLGH